MATIVPLSHTLEAAVVLMSQVPWIYFLFLIGILHNFITFLTGINFGTINPNLTSHNTSAAELSTLVMSALPNHTPLVAAVM